MDHERNHGNAGRAREAEAESREIEDKVEIDLLDGNGRHRVEQRSERFRDGNLQKVRDHLVLDVRFSSTR